MANGHGGARRGAGRKKKSLQAKLELPASASGDAGSPESGQFTFESLPELPVVSKHLTRAQHSQNTDLLAKKFFDEIWLELYQAGCETYFSKSYMEDYAMQRARYVQLEELISQFGFGAKDKGKIVANPLEQLRQGNLKILNNMRAEIDKVIREHGFKPIEPSDPMAQLIGLAAG